ncbi:MAG: efflux RND transporter permease subunit [Acidobacteriota bacterium]
MKKIARPATRDSVLESLLARSARPRVIGLCIVGLLYASCVRFHPKPVTPAAALGMLPLAYGIGSGADMPKPLAIAAIGALCISVMLSLVATPVTYFLMVGRRRNTGE